jgi:hypothetical protein
MRIFLAGRQLLFVGPWIMICHGILSLQTHCKRFNQDCSKICSSLQQQAAAAASAPAAAAAAAAAATSVPNLRRQILCPLQMPLVRRSHRFGITVLIHLEAAGNEKVGEGRWHYGWGLHPWTPYRREGRWHYRWLHPWTPGGTMDDFIHGRHTGGRASGTRDDFIHGRQGALWMTSSMDATEGGKQKVLHIVLV